MTKNCCATCGQAVPEFGGIIADDDRGEVRFRGRRVLGLTRGEWAVFRYLLDAKGKVKSKGEIMDFIYQLEPGDQPDIKIIDVWVCKLRKKLEPLGLGIGTAWARGYFLEEPAAPKAAETAISTASTPLRVPPEPWNISELREGAGLMRDVSAPESAQNSGGL